MTAPSFIHRKKSPILGLCVALSCYGGSYGLMATTAFANDPTSLLNPSVIKNPSESNPSGTNPPATNTGQTPYKNTDNPSSATVSPASSPSEQTPSETPSDDEAKNQKELEDLLNELNQKPDYSEKTQLATTPASGVVQRETLDTLNEDSFGLVEPNQDTINLWRNTPYGNLVSAVKQANLSITSPTLYQYTMDAMVLGARAPALESPYTKGDYLLARVALLSRAGHIKTAQKLLSDSPIGTSPEQTGTLLNLTLLQHDIPGACLLSKTLAAEPTMPASVDPLLVKQLVILCKGISDNPATAYIAGSALQETSEQVSFLFVDTLDFLNGGPPPEEKSLIELTPFTLLLARITGMAINKDLLAQASPAVLHSAWEHPNTTDEARVYALEQLARTGAISTKQLTEGYNRIAFNDDQLRYPLQSLYNLSPPLQRALLVRTSAPPTDTTTDDIPEGWRNAIALLKRTKNPEDYIMISKALAVNFAQLPTTSNLDANAATIARVLLSAGYVTEAQQWYDNRHNFDGASSNEIATLYPALLASDASVRKITLDDAKTKEWAEQMAGYKQHGLKAFTRGLSILATLGFDIDERLWSYLDKPFLNSNDTFVALPNSSLTLLEKYAQSGLFKPKATLMTQGQTEAVNTTNTGENNNTGENTNTDKTTTPPSRTQVGMTALYAMNLVGKQTAATLSDGQVIRVLEALRHGIGDDIARSYAVEALVRQYSSTQ